jgi:TP901 family phage tail tape measure protein
MSKTASSAESVGSSFQNTTAMMAVMIEATRESAENIGSAMKSIISRYGELKENKTGIDSEGEEYSLNKVDKALQSVGLSIHDANGEFREFDDVIMELAEKWDTIDKNTQRYIATVMAGNRQQSRFLALVSSYDRLKELSAEAADSEDAAQLQFLKTLDSVDAKTQQLQTSLQSLYVDSGLENMYKGILDIANNIIQSFT